MPEESKADYSFSLAVNVCVVLLMLFEIFEMRILSLLFIMPFNVMAIVYCIRKGAISNA